jgi:hypothetical protein
MVNFQFLEGSHQLVRRQALKIMGEAFRHWKSDLNKNYIQKGLTPFNEWGHITPSQWVDLVAQKTTPVAFALSARNTKLAKKNKHHHHLGLDVYIGKEEQFRKMEEEAATSGSFSLSGLHASGMPMTSSSQRT